MGIRTDSRALVTTGGQTGASWTLLGAEVWQGCWKQQLRREEFKLGAHKYEEYKGVLFGNGDCALVVDVWLHRVDEDVSGLTFEEWGGIYFLWITTMSSGHDVSDSPRKP